MTRARDLADGKFATDVEVENSTAGAQNMVVIHHASNTSGDESKIQFKRTTDGGSDREVAAIVADRVGGNDTALVFETNTDGSDGATERVRIDQDGNMLVGKTATGLSTTGFQALATGNQSAFISDGDRALILNRQTSDGSVLEFRKDGSIVGTIATVSDDLNIFSNTANHTGLRFALNAVLPTNTNGSVVDDAVDLGKSSANYRFKDLYLSGGAYIGGTAAANKLDDYEEGTFTPILKATTTNPTVSYNSQYGTYTKIGNLVLVQISVDMSSVSGGSGNAFIGDLPFTSANNGANASPHSVMLYNVNVPDDSFAVALRTRNNTADTRFLSMRDNSTWSNMSVSDFAGSSKVVIATVTYMAA